MKTPLESVDWKKTAPRHFPVLLKLKESEFFGLSRSRIPNNTRSRSRIFLSDSDSRYPIGSFFTSHS